MLLVGERRRSRRHSGAIRRERSEQSKRARAARPNKALTMGGAAAALLRWMKSGAEPSGMREQLGATDRAGK